MLVLSVVENRREMWIKQDETTCDVAGKNATFNRHFCGENICNQLATTIDRRTSRC